MSAKNRAFDRQLSREDHQDVLGNPDSSWRTPGRFKREEKLVLLDKILRGVDEKRIQDALSPALRKLGQPSTPLELQRACSLIVESQLAIRGLYENPREIRKVAPKLRESLLEGYSILVELGFATRHDSDNQQH